MFPFLSCCIWLSSWEHAKISTPSVNEEVLEPVFPTAAADDFILPPPPPHCTHAALPTALSSLSGYFAMQISSLCTISRERKKKNKNRRLSFGNLRHLSYTLPSPVTKALQTDSFHSRSCIQQAFADYITFTNLKFLSSPKSSMHLGIKFL